MFMEKIMPFILMIVFFAILPVTRIIRDGIRRMKDNRSEEIIISAQVTGKRVDTAKVYYATFLTATGESIEFELGGSSYGALASGAQGTLTYQGKNFISFKAS